MCQKLLFKSAAKLLYHTAKTCQYVDFLHKKAHFMKKCCKDTTFDCHITAVE